jgi:hypothetical protein
LPVAGSSPSAQAPVLQPFRENRESFPSDCSACGGNRSGVVDANRRFFQSTAGLKETIGDAANAFRVRTFSEDSRQGSFIEIVSLDRDTEPYAISKAHGDVVIRTLDRLGQYRQDDQVAIDADEFPGKTGAAL